MRPLWIVGGGGHARVVIDAARASMQFDVVGIFDDTTARWGTEVDGVQIVGGASPATMSRLDVRHAVIAVGRNDLRSALVRRLAGWWEWATIIHPFSYVAPGVSLGEGTVVFAGAVLQPGVTVGNHVVLNTTSSVDHDGVVEDYAQLGPGAHLAGNVRIGQGAFLGTGAGVIPGCSVGAWSIVGAGAVVVRDVPARVVVKGVPARISHGLDAMLNPALPSVDGSP